MKAFVARSAPYLAIAVIMLLIFGGTQFPGLRPTEFFVLVAITVLSLWVTIWPPDRRA